MLEEAAGIAGLHVRRKDAEQKLRAAETNLARLAEILLDMDARANALRRQARAAERYIRLSDQIRVAEARALFARWREAVRMRRASGLLAENSQGRVTAPWIAIEKTSANEFRQWCAEFGFTPAAEKALAGEVGNVTSPGADPGNPF